MRKIIRLLAKISGVEKEIRKDERECVGGEIISTSFWFSEKESYGTLFPFLYSLGLKLKNGYFIRGDWSRIKWLQLSKEKPVDEKGRWDTNKITI